MRLVYRNTASSAAVANTTTETVFDKSFDFGADALRAGQVVKFTAAGKFSTTGTPTLQVKLKVGTINVLDSGAITTASGAANLKWRFEGEITVRTGGASGVLSADGVFSYETAAGTTVSFIITNAAQSGNLATQSLCKASAQWSAASASNTTLMENFRLWVTPA